MTAVLNSLLTEGADFASNNGNSDLAHRLDCGLYYGLVGKSSQKAGETI